MKLMFVITVVVLLATSLPIYSFFSNRDTLPKIKNIELSPAVNNSQIVQVSLEGDVEKKSKLTLLYRRIGWRNWNEAVAFQRYSYDTLVTKRGSVVTDNKFLGRLFYLYPNANYEARFLLKIDGTVVTDTLVNFYTGNVGHSGHFGGQNDILVSSDDELKNALKNIGSSGTIVLAPGVYNGPFVLDNILARNLTITIKAYEFGAVFIEPKDNSVAAFAINSSNNITFKNLVFRNASIGFDIKNSNLVEIFNCVFEQVKNPVIVENSQHVSINNSQFEYNNQGNMANEAVAVTIKNSSFTPVVFSFFEGFSKGVVIESTTGGTFDFFISNNDFCRIKDVAISVENISSSGVIKSNRFTNGALAIGLLDVAMGPLYIFRNVIFNYESGINIYGYSRGIEIYHNNFFTTKSAFSGEAKWSNLRIINNVFLPVAGYSFYSGSFLNNSVISGNAFDLSNHFFIKWSSNKGESYIEYRHPRDIFFETGYFDNSINTSYSDFNHIPLPNALREHDKKFLDWYPLKHSVLVNGARSIAGINSDFYGSAPDIGAQEYGDSLEIFGPRIIEKGAAVMLDENDEIIERVTVFPNPFNSSTNLDFRLNRSSQLSIEIYDITGRLLKEVFKGEADFGDVKKTISFDGLNVPSGIYFIKIQVGGSVRKERICYIK